MVDGILMDVIVFIIQPLMLITHALDSTKHLLCSTHISTMTDLWSSDLMQDRLLPASVLGPPVILILSLVATILNWVITHYGALCCKVCRALAPLALALTQIFICATGLRCLCFITVGCIGLARNRLFDYNGNPLWLAVALTQALIALLGEMSLLSLTLFIVESLQLRRLPRGIKELALWTLWENLCAWVRCGVSDRKITWLSRKLITGQCL